ncbi:hypothetical protein [Ligilactobacillus faecis]|uniref:hypothetical protein n=1 Tax=Ligilactobacillus faecis TaxID=762833 RepID=UPI0024684C31|nr:hypothetical protein [Ligilactobacillus faecis]WGN89551.1 hypothetical protein QFX10_00125 [Ligilactobacillus faecis]
MKERQKLIKQISFRLYDNPRDQKIYEFLQGSAQNQSEYIRSLIEHQMKQSEQISENKIVPIKPQKHSMQQEKPKKSFSSGFAGFRA